MKKWIKYGVGFLALLGVILGFMAPELVSRAMDARRMDAPEKIGVDQVQLAQYSGEELSLFQKLQIIKENNSLKIEQGRLHTVEEMVEQLMANLAVLFDSFGVGFDPGWMKIVEVQPYLYPNQTEPGQTVVVFHFVGYIEGTEEYFSIGVEEESGQIVVCGMEIVELVWGGGMQPGKTDADTEAILSDYSYMLAMWYAEYLGIEVAEIRQDPYYSHRWILVLMENDEYLQYSVAMDDTLNVMTMDS